MAMELSAEPRGRLRIPFGTLLVGGVLAVGLAIGFHAFGAPSNAGATGASLPIIQLDRMQDAGRVTNPAGAPAVPADACDAMDATAFKMYCVPARGTGATPPRAVWEACAAMDEKAYRMYCSAGEGGRSFKALEPN